MCGRLNIADPQKISNLLAGFNITLAPESFYAGRFKRATDTIAVLQSNGSGYQLNPAIWWLLLERTLSGFKASKYTSFNTRYDKLNVPRSAGYKAFRESRCIIPVNGFGESQYHNGKPQHYHDMMPENEVLLMGGLTRYWHHPKTEAVQQSCSVITLPPHPKLKHIHAKSMPLILPQEKTVIEQWLNPELKDVSQFDSLLEPHLPQSLYATPIDKPSTYHAVGPVEMIAADGR